LLLDIDGARKTWVLEIFCPREIGNWDFSCLILEFFLKLTPKAISSWIIFLSFRIIILIEK
jgi:hypothetical protein